MNSSPRLYAARTNARTRRLAEPCGRKNMKRRKQSGGLAAASLRVTIETPSEFAPARPRDRAMAKGKAKDRSL